MPPFKSEITGSNESDMDILDAKMVCSIYLNAEDDYFFSMVEKRSQIYRIVKSNFVSQGRASAAQQQSIKNASSWSSLAQTGGGPGGVGSRNKAPVMKDSFQQFKKQAQEKEARMKQQEIKRRQQEQVDRERQRNEQEKRVMKEEEEALERARRAIKTEQAPPPLPQPSAIK